MQAPPSPGPGGLRVPSRSQGRYTPGANQRPTGSQASLAASSSAPSVLSGTAPSTGPLPPRGSRGLQPPPSGRRPPPRPQGGMPPPSSVYPTPQLQQGWRPGIRKRIVVCCDGTWLDSDAGQTSPNEMQLASNVTRIGRAIKPQSSDGVPQIVFYQAGVGTEGSYLQRVAGGATAEGLAGNIREAYAFICLNWDPGDEIFLIGFSRGAYTARSVSGLIAQVGVLTKTGLKDLAVIFKDVQCMHDPKYDSQYPGLPFPDKPSALDPRYARELARLGLSRLDVPIRAIAVWDTVGSLGIPRVPWLEKLGLQRRAVREYTFYDTSLGKNIENAFQALALDEQRSSFVPTLWEHPRPPGRERSGRGSKGKQPQPPPPPQGPAAPRTNLRQVWFPGVHSNCGGGYPDPGQANITLAWMVAQLEPFLDFDLSYLQAQWSSARAYYQQTNQPPRPWSFGEIYRSLTGLYALAGSTVRTPGRYMRLDPWTGSPTRSRLRDTCEYVHPSVRSRLNLEGPGIEDRGVYEPRALAGYRLRLTGASLGENRPVAVWESTERRRKGGDAPRRVLEESPLFNTELNLLKASPWVEQALYGKGPGAGGRGGGSRRRAGGVAEEVYGPGSDVSANPPLDEDRRNAANIGFVAPTGRRNSDGARRPGEGALAGEGRRRKRRDRDKDGRRQSAVG